jgi:23S rRNA G2069 N7-methylase RlmK/C1962 C5-methylase RlmI
MDWNKLFSEALLKRVRTEKRLENDQEIGRIFAGAADGVSGLMVDAFGPLVVLTLYNPDLAPHALEILTALRRLFGPQRHVLAKVRKKEGGYAFIDDDEILGRSWQAQEDECIFEVRADSENDFGLFPDARPARLALREMITADSVVLNLFSYTCGFSVVAMRNGAQHAINVDASSDMLTWGKRNAALNGVDFAVVPELTQKYLKRLERRVSEGKLSCPDIWICDPPAFGVGRGMTRLLKNFWTDFWMCVEALQPRALIVLRNDRTGHRKGDTFRDELLPKLGSTYQIEPVSFDQCPSLCYGSGDGYYNLNESLILLRR